MANIESLEYSRLFLKNISRLPKRVINVAQKKERLFRVEPFHPSLRTHKLHGKDQGAWGFWIDFHYRVKFMFITESEVLFLDVGLHDIYD